MFLPLPKESLTNRKKVLEKRKKVLKNTPCAEVHRGLFEKRVFF